VKYGNATGCITLAPLTPQFWGEITRDFASPLILRGWGANAGLKGENNDSS
jgi:hypothetical protein